jgi:hypothetical protein
MEKKMTNKNKEIVWKKWPSYEELYKELALIFQGEFTFCKKCNNMHRAGYCCMDCGYGGE